MDKIKKIMSSIGNDSKITVGLLLALFPIIIGSSTWVSVQIATLRNDLSHYEKRISYLEAKVTQVEEKTQANERDILRISK